MVRLSEMDSGSIVFAGRTGRGGKAAGGATGVARGRVGGGRGRAAAVPAMSRWEGESGDGRDGGGGDGGRKTCVSSRNFLTEGS